MKAPNIRFALISRQRSGTKFFKLTLSKHPEIFTHPEVLSLSKEKWKLPTNVHHFMMKRYSEEPSSIMENRCRHNYADYIQYLYNAPYSRIVGLDLKYNQLSQFPTFKSCLENENIHVIHLIRKNVLRQYLSELQYKHLDRTNLPDEKIYETGALPITPIPLTCDDTLLKDLRFALERIEEYREFLKSRFNYLEVHYESFIPKGQFVATEFPNPILQSVYDFLEVEDRHFVPNVSRKAQHPYLIEELIPNYDEVYDFLSKDGLEYLLDDDYAKPNSVE